MNDFVSFSELVSAGEKNKLIIKQLNNIIRIFLLAKNGGK
jgi:hypothetical protein